VLSPPPTSCLIPSVLEEWAGARHGGSVPALLGKGLGKWEGDTGGTGCPAAPWGRNGAAWGGSCNDGYGQRMGVAGGSRPTAGAKGALHQGAWSKPCWVLSPAALGGCTQGTVQRGPGYGGAAGSGPPHCAGHAAKETIVLCFSHSASAPSSGTEPPVPCRCKPHWLWQLLVPQHG